MFQLKFENSEVVGVSEFLAVSLPTTVHMDVWTCGLSCLFTFIADRKWCVPLNICSTLLPVICKYVDMMTISFHFLIALCSHRYFNSEQASDLVVRLCGFVDSLPQRPSQKGCIRWKRRQIPKWLDDNNRMWFGQNVRREQEGQYYSNRIWPSGYSSYYWSFSPLAQLHHWSYALISISHAIINWALPQCHFDNVPWNISWATHSVNSIFKLSLSKSHLCEISSRVGLKTRLENFKKNKHHPIWGQRNTKNKPCTTLS